jgi:RHH-type proline utilization regulon transcriptional repressor/proline dehydrogenase/delta 1-pyrroline-5-carboxylate dehydrogenase
MNQASAGSIVPGTGPWDLCDHIKYQDEDETIGALLARPPLAPAEQASVRVGAEGLVRDARKHARRQGVVESFLQEFSLSTPEGLALMGLAEALLRTPDVATQDRLIAERVGPADWAAHLGQSSSLFVNASTWGLLLTGKIVDPATLRANPDALRRLIARLGEPVVRAAVARAIRIMGEQFVLGRTIEDALARARREGYLCSFDMLGEGARTAAEAERYEAAYAHAIQAIGRATEGLAPEAGHGVSVKLSALSPRYEVNQGDRVWSELYPRLLRLARLAAAADINFTLDAEECDRLVVSLEILERLCGEAELGGWAGLGLAVQAYQKRAPLVIDRITGLARRSGRRLMVRLVKGAYWDSEIKRAQVAGRPDYPVYTTKAATDLSYLVCARALIEASPYLYAQFATHNAHSLAAVREMAKGRGVAIEFQRLHGMGEALYQAASKHGGLTLRAYAPVGGHEDLLPYLVRRLLENGANTSFVHLLLNDATPVEQVVRDPLDLLSAGGRRHPKIPVPRKLYDNRLNSKGLDVTMLEDRNRLTEALARLDQTSIDGCPIVSGHSVAEGPFQTVVNPYRPGVIVGRGAGASSAQVSAAFAAAKDAQPAWDRAGGPARAKVLDAMAEALESGLPHLAALCVREAGKTWLDAVAEVREAVDFCRYYATLAAAQFNGEARLRGPVGETNGLSLHGRGVFVCISPWNFPLAIFTGQIAAALAAGNAVLAKPAEQTPLIAAEAVRLFLAAGLDRGLLHLLPGPGAEVGAALVVHPDCDGVAFTGGTDTARRINRALAERDGPIIPFIAETGGLNGMFVDTTAQREQVIDDVLLSAFGSAGQRCSALRLLFLPEETADDLIEGLIGAMDALILGDPARFDTDIGPVIDAEAKAALDAHVFDLRQAGRVLKRLTREDEAAASPLLFEPTLAEITLDDLPDREVFGPILHVVRYRSEDLDAATSALAAKRYGLTLGIHSRLESFAERVRAGLPAGNTYVNRSMIGAVVGVQPFGGEGLSGTGPKAGGPFALTRYGVERAVSVNITAQGGDPALLNL